MTKEEKQRGLELQGYINSIRGMTIKDIAIKYLKKHHLPKFLVRLLVDFSYPLLLTKDYELVELQEKLKTDLIANLKEKMQYSTSPSCTKGMELFIKTIEKWELKENTELKENADVKESKE